MTLQEVQGIFAEAHEEATELTASMQLQAFREAVLATREAIRKDLVFERARKEAFNALSPLYEKQSQLLRKAGKQVSGDSSQPTPRTLQGYAQVALIGICIGTLVGKFLL